MNKIELLPKNLEFGDTCYQLRMWVTFKNYLCIGYVNSFYVNSFKPLNSSLFAVCVEPENEPISIASTVGCLNEYIGNEVSVDDACEELLNWIEKNKEDFKTY